MSDITGIIVCLILVIGYFLCFLVKFNSWSALSDLAVAGNKRQSNEVFGLSFLYWVSPVFLLSAVGLATYLNLIPQTWVPTPDRILQSLIRLTESGILFSEASVSIQRVALGFLAASIIGVSVGLVAGTFTSARVLILPTNSFLRYIPPTAFITLLIVYFGIGESYKYAVIFFGVVFFIIQMVADIVEDIDVKHIEMGRTCELSNAAIFHKIVLPYAMPRVFDVLRINLSAAWTFLVVAEIIGSDRGLGHLIAVSQRFLRLDDLYVGILMFGVIGLFTDRALDFYSRRQFRWYYISIGQ